jgi:hypothetical protein
MAVNPFFRDYRGEQKLLDDLTIETIRAMGRDMIYIPREALDIDLIFGEDPTSSFSDSYRIEMYIQNVTSFGNQMNIVNKFGISITDRVTFQLSKTRFAQEITTKNSTILTPREGDLIFFPLNKSLFEINYVEDKIPFFQFGSLTTYTLTCELFTYSFEDIETGVSEIDEVQDDRQYNMEILTISSLPISGSIRPRRGDTIYQVSGVTGAGATYANATGIATIVEYSGLNAYIKGLTGTFVAGPTGTQSIKTYGTGITLTEYYLLGITTTNVNLSVDPISGVNIMENDLYSQAADGILEFNKDDPFSEECD